MSQKFVNLSLEGKVSAKQTDEVVAERDEIKIERWYDREEWRDLNSGFAPRLYLSQLVLAQNLRKGFAFSRVQIR